jgi:hypothetical protein
MRAGMSGLAITSRSKDLADMYIHEGYTNYSETLFVEYMYGKDAGNAYNYGIRKGIRNDRPVIPRYGVNEQGSGDMYPKASNMLHSIRHSWTMTKNVPADPARDE